MTAKTDAHFEPARLQALASVLALGLITLFAARLFWPLMTPRGDFYNELWGPAYLLLHGKSAYDTASLNPILPAAWFPMAIGFFSALGWLPENLALQVWFMLNVIEIALIVYRAQGKARSLLSTVLAAFLCFYFPPVLNHLSLGQLSITVTLSVLLAAECVNAGLDWPAALCVALALSKPHLAILPVLAFSYRYYQNAKIRGLVSFWGKILLMVLLCCLPLFLAHPIWIPDAIASMLRNPEWPYPTLFMVFVGSLGAWGYTVWGVLVALVLGICYLLWKTLPLASATYWSLALGLLVSPYAGSWDFVLLLPLLVLTYAQADWRRKVLILVSYALAWYGMALVQAQPLSHNHSFWWVPVWFVVTLALATDWTRQPGLRPAGRALSAVGDGL